jgi:hypothetical protein
MSKKETNKVKFLQKLQILRNGLACLVLAAPLTPATSHAQTTRDQIGAVFAYPYGVSWTDLGAYVGPPKSLDFFNMTPQSTKVIHTRFHVFRETDQTQWAWFPYSALRAYEASEIAAGRPPIFVTAFYQGKSRPVVWNWSLGLQGSDSGRPKTASSNWEYAVNVADDRFINFWINNYIRSIILSGYGSLQNVWIGLDECAFIPALYGVIDDSGNFISGVKWDAPFAQNASQYYQSINRFFTRVRQLAPSLKLMPNSGGLADWSQFSNTFGAAQGLLVEELNQSTSVPAGGMYTRNLLVSQLGAYTADASSNHTLIYGSVMSSSDRTRITTSYLMYLLVEGSSTFYAPAMVNTYNTLPPSLYDKIATTLGSPTASLQSQQLPGTPSYDPGLRTYWRQFQHGLIYLNWTGSTQVIKLPAGRTYFSPSGKPVTTLTLADLTAGYVTF